jgi:hypothetical protein
MNSFLTPLPTAQELEKLPLRAVVAYAARTSRRLSAELRGIVADDILEDALRLVEAVPAAEVMAGVDKASVIRAVGKVAAAYADAPTNLKSVVRFHTVFSMTHAAETAMFAIIAATDPDNAHHQMKLAADEAERAVRSIEVLNSTAARAAIKAARQDYEILLRESGGHEEVVIGAPIKCFSEEE